MEKVTSADDWKSRYKPIEDWDRMFAEGQWQYLDDPGEAARYALIAGYVHRHSGRVSVLDVGCGSGLLLRYLDHSRVRYCGIDVSAKAIEQARNRFPRGDFAVSSIEGYQPLASPGFDVVVFNEVLPHIDDPLGQLARYLAFVRPGGVAAVSTYQNTNSRSNAAMFTELLDRALRDGIFTSLTGCEVTTFDRGLKWRIDVLARESGDHGQY